MRVRKANPTTGDMQFGRGQSDYWYNSPRGVGQLVSSRLRLWLGQWYLNVPDGTPYLTQVLGFRTDDSRDAAIRKRIFETPGVLEITQYSSEFDPQGRTFVIHATIGTIYGSYPFEFSA